jgi:hypothetical protein
MHRQLMDVGEKQLAEPGMYRARVCAPYMQTNHDVVNASTQVEHR